MQSSKMSRLIAAGVLLLVTLYTTRGEVFTAITHMEGLVGLEKNLLQGLNAYLTAERARLNALEEFADKVDKIVESASGDASNHLHHPVNAFQLVNRYTNGWMKLHEHIYRDNGQDLMANISLNRYQFPADEDFNGAATALHRLQDTYNVPAIEMARAKLGKEDDGGLPLTSADCYKVGRVAYNDKDWKHTREWMLAALEQFDHEQDSTLDIAGVYDHLAFAEYSLGNMKRAAQYTREMLQHDPTHERGLSNRAYFNKMAEQTPDKFMDTEETTHTDTEHSRYEKLCREAEPIPKKDHPKLMCYYYSANNTNPRLLIQPIKVEIMWLSPKILMFRDFVSEAEMDRLKELANPKLNRATVHGENGKLIPATYRISKSGWLSPEDDPLGYITRIDQRIEDATGLTMSTAEQLQVVNYGIGGHYEPHYDFARRDEDAFSTLGTGNRIATLLLYMSDVVIGGATVFPAVGARIAPSNGDAAYWYNLMKSGEGDYSTRHAGCPVLVGSKWVCNKWIHERGQEFRRRCGLDPKE